MGTETGAPTPNPVAESAMEPVAWMYEHPLWDQHGVPPVFQKERADERRPNDGWTETPLYAHRTPTDTGLVGELVTELGDDMVVALRQIYEEGMNNHSTRCRSWWPLVVSVVKRHDNEELQKAAK